MTDTAYYNDTPQAVRDALEDARLGGYPVRLFYGDTATGKAWPEEHDVAGTVGRSTGSVKVPLLVPRNSHGGPHVLDHCIVAILRAPGVYSYRHPSFDPGTWTVLQSEMPGDPRPGLVWLDGKPHAAFATIAKADRYAAFMRGHRMTK